MLDIINPHTLINSTVLARVCPLSVRFVVFELSFKLIAVRVPKAPLVMSSVFLPVTPILCSVGPHLNAISMSHPKRFFYFWLTANWFELTSVNGPVLVDQLVHIDKSVVLQKHFSV